MKTTLENSLDSLKTALPVLEVLGEADWNETNIHSSLFALIEALGIKNGQMLWPVRTAVSGWEVTPGGAIELADILGREETLRRIRVGIDRLSAELAKA